MFTSLLSKLKSMVNSPSEAECLEQYIRDHSPQSLYEIEYLERKYNHDKQRTPQGYNS